MRNWLSIVLVALSGLVVVSCGGSSSGDGSGTGGMGGSRGLTCETLANPPEGCDDSCPSGSDSECQLGTFCLNGTCSAQCVTNDDCINATCNARGRCIPSTSTGGTGGTGNTGANACQSVTVTPTRSIPNVMFLVDQSGSMLDPFPGSANRWEGAHEAITTIVSERASIVNFGLTTYTSDNGNEFPPCPRLPTQIPFGQSGDITNPSVYDPSYPSNDGADTPTGDSIDALVAWIQDPLNAPPADEPTIIVLATDGLPDSCECPDGYPPDINDDYCEPGAENPQVEAVDAAAAAHAAGIDVYALWVGDLDPDPSDPTRSHMQDVADAGVVGSGTVYVGNNPTSLSDAFSDIVEDSISCDITMAERFVDGQQACAEGDVQLDGVQIPCVAPDGDGWLVKPGEDQVIQLVGTACDTLKTGDVTFSAEFPCGSVVVE